MLLAGLNDVRALAFNYFHYSHMVQPDVYLGLAVACTELRVIYFSVRRWYLDMGTGRDTNKIERLAEMYSLRKLLACRKLERVIWRTGKGIGTTVLVEVSVYMDDVAIQALEGLEGWVEEGFVERGQVVRCVYLHAR